jgi:hypothetical protein
MKRMESSSVSLSVHVAFACGAVAAVAGMMSGCWDTDADDEADEDDIHRCTHNVGTRHTTGQVLDGIIALHTAVAPRVRDARAKTPAADPDM